jgi:curved DNA-binding protein CbpA
MNQPPTNNPPTSEIDYYELLEASENARPETIEMLFRFKGQQLHAQLKEGTDEKELVQLAMAYKTLSNPEAREEYDRKRRERMDKAAAQKNPTNSASQLDSDLADRQKILSTLYFQRRKSMRQPGVGDSTLEAAAGCTPEELNFHLWYMGERGWLRREESGSISITATGVDKIENEVQRKAELERRAAIESRG